MKKHITCLSLFACITLFSAQICAEEHEIAITIDDLPFVGTNSPTEGNLTRAKNRFMLIVQSLVDNHVPATGFVIAGSICKGQWELLEQFRKEGFEVGNHTYSHANLNAMSAKKYIDEIARADKILAPVMTQPKYFRYPYLAEGKGATKQEVQDFLTANQYTVAPVTIDSKDYMFNERLLRYHWRTRNEHLGEIKRQYLDYIWKQTVRAEKNSNGNAKQILLIHANLLNSHFLGDIIQMYKEHGYRFITLGQALTNAAPAAGPMSNDSGKEPPAMQESKKSIKGQNSAFLNSAKGDWVNVLEAMW